MHVQHEILVSTIFTPSMGHMSCMAACQPSWLVYFPETSMLVQQDRPQGRQGDAKAHCTVSLMGLLVWKLPDTPKMSTLLATVACRVCCTGSSASRTTWYWLALAAGVTSTLNGTQTLTALKGRIALVFGAACVIMGSVPMP